MSYICRRDDECVSFSIPGEHRLTLRARNGDDYQRFCFRQIIGDSEVKKCQALLTEFFIQQTLRVASFDFLFQIAEVLDRYDASFAVAFYQTMKEFFGGLACI